MTYGTGGGYGGGSGGPYQQWSPHGYDTWPEQRGGVSAGLIVLIALLTVVVLALLGVVAYLFLRPGGVSGTPDEQAVAASSSSSTPPAPSTSREPVTETAYTTPPEQETVTVTRPAERPPNPGTAYPAGADRSGWTSNTQSRCNAGDPAAMIGRTSQASFSICVNPDNGRYYYRGSASGSGVEVDDPVVSGASATVTNNNVVYSISSGGMVIYENGEVISSQAMVDFWVG